MTATFLSVSVGALPAGKKSARSPVPETFRPLMTIASRLDSDAPDCRSAPRQRASAPARPSRPLRPPSMRYAVTPEGLPAHWLFVCAVARKQKELADRSLYRPDCTVYSALRSGPQDPPPAPRPLLSRPGLLVTAPGWFNASVGAPRPRADAAGWCRSCRTEP